MENRHTWKIYFKFSQNEFIKSQHTDRNIYNGLCFFMCVDYIYNKSNNIKCDFIFFSKTYAFSSRYRGMLLAYESGAIKNPYLIKNGKIIKKIKESVNPVEIYNIKDDSYVINLSLSNGKMSHATAFIKMVGTLYSLIQTLVNILLKTRWSL